MTNPPGFEMFEKEKKDKREPCNGKQMRQQIMNREQIAGQHEYHGPDKCPFLGGFHVDEKQIDCDAGQQKVKNDQPVPDDREWEKQIEEVRRIEHSRLQCRKKRYAAKLVADSRTERFRVSGDLPTGVLVG